MKISKIFAGMSAAAIAASMMAALPASADYALAEVAANDVTSYEGYGAQGFVMGSATWNWQSDMLDSDADGKVTGEFDFKSIGARSKADTDESVGDAGVQIYANTGDLAKNQFVTVDVEYKITTSDGQTFEGTSAIDTSKQETTNVQFDIWGYGTSWEVLDTATATVEITFSNAKVHDLETEPEWNTKTEVENTGDYAGDWKGDGFMYDDLSKADTSKNMKVTIEYETLDGFDYYLAGLVDAHGWTKLYDESNDEKKNAIQGVTLKSSLSAEELEATEDPVLQNDGYFVIKKSGKLTFKVDGAALDAAIAKAKDDPNDEGEIWYGLGFQVYGIKITKATYEYVAEQEETTVDTVEYNEEITPDSNFSIKSSDFDATYVKAGLNLHFSKDNWNDWCDIAVKVKAGDKTKYYLLEGKQVGWDVTAEILSLDEDGDPYEVIILPQDKAKFMASKDYEEGVTIIPDYEIINTIAAGDDYTLNIPEIGNAEDWQIDILCLCWNTDGSPSVEDPDGTAKLDDLKAPLEDGTEKTEPWVLKLVSADFTVGEVTPVEPEPEPKDEPKEDPKKEDPKKEDEPKKEDSKPTGGDNTSNPKTGAAALALGTIALAGAAVVVSKKKD